MSHKQSAKIVLRASSVDWGRVVCSKELQVQWFAHDKQNLILVQWGSPSFYICYLFFLSLHIEEGWYPLDTYLIPLLGEVLDEL